MEKTPYDKFCVSAYKTNEPNNMESGINEYISITGDRSTLVKICLIVSHALNSGSGCAPISIHFRYKASATFMM
jgi:hypothetical protein